MKARVVLIASFILSVIAALVIGIPGPGRQMGPAQASAYTPPQAVSRGILCSGVGRDAGDATGTGIQVTLLDGGTVTAGCEIRNPSTQTGSLWVSTDPRVTNGAGAHPGREVTPGGAPAWSIATALPYVAEDNAGELYLCECFGQ